jgi:hypothetical protein
MRRKLMWVMFLGARDRGHGPICQARSGDTGYWGIHRYHARRGPIR